MKIFLIYILHRFFLPNSNATKEWHMLVLLNKQRKAHKLPPLSMASDLRIVARNHSKDMAKKEYFAHENKENQSPHERIQEARISDSHTGENLAFVQGYQHPTSQAMKGLMNSKGHRENILRTTFTTVGIGLYVGLAGKHYYTQNFAGRHIHLKKIPKKISLGKKVRIQGAHFAKEKPVILQISEHGVLLINEKFPPQKDLRTHFTPPHTGTFTIQLFIQDKQQLIGSNVHVLQCVKPWWQRLF